MGNVITMPVAGLLCEYGFAEGWGSVFYVFGKFNTALKWNCILMLDTL
jgi:ACS family sodium-dependent inorganic phosphate cotransporter-like MFS transporter 5